MRQIIDRASGLTMLIGRYKKDQLDAAIRDNGPDYVYCLFAKGNKVGDSSGRKGTTRNRIDENLNRRFGPSRARVIAVFHPRFRHKPTRRLVEGRLYFALRDFVRMENKRERAGVCPGDDEAAEKLVRNSPSLVERWIEFVVEKADQFGFVPRGTFDQYQSLVKSPWFELLLARGEDVWCRVEYINGWFRVPAGTPALSESGQIVRIKNDLFFNSPSGVVSKICRSVCDGRSRIIKCGHGGKIGDWNLEFMGTRKPMHGIWKFAA